MKTTKYLNTNINLNTNLNTKYKIFFLKFLQVKYEALSNVFIIIEIMRTFSMRYFGIYVQEEGFEHWAFKNERK